jgi:4'-phosphopantetheinyl transferase
MNLYISNIADVKSRHREYITPTRLEQAMRYRMQDDRLRCIAGGVLLRHFVGNTEIFKNEFGKPIAENGVCFNLSHSGDWVLLAVHSADVGCDIEKLRYTRYERMGKIVFTERELAQIHLAFDKMNAFYQIWTKKEALLKCMGKGFHRAAKSVDVCGGTFAEDGHVYTMGTKLFADYAVSVCVRDGAVDMTTEWVRF